MLIIIIAGLLFWIWVVNGSHRVLEDEYNRKLEQRRQYQRDYYYRKKLTKAKK